MNDTIIAKLDTLAEMQGRRDVVALEKQAAIDAILTPEIHAALDSIEAQYRTIVAELSEQIATTEGDCKALVLAAGESVKARWLHAVWCKPRISWDTKGLDGYAVAHPEITTFRQTGEPSVTLRRV
jgi:hypothetical protein